MCRDRNDMNIEQVTDSTANISVQRDKAEKLDLEKQDLNINEAETTVIKSLIKDSCR